MGHQFAELTFTPTVRALQREAGSRSSYRAMAEGEDYNHRMLERESSFIAQRDSMYMASVGETGWPYIQHRGGPMGFVKVIDESHIGFADYSGNRQYVSTGNFLKEERVALFFMDYVNRRRLKLLGRVKVVGIDQSPILEKLRDDGYVASIERGFVIKVEAFDWNCPQHITPRYTQQQIEAEILSTMSPITRLEQDRPISEQQQIIGDGPLELMVSGMRQLTPAIRSYELRRRDGKDLPAFEAGSHLRIPLRLANGQLTEREYSIASNPNNRDFYEIAVLREFDGRGGSRAIHEGFELGTQLNTNRPVSQFPLHEDARPALLIAGGIGVTPLRSMASELRRTDREFSFRYAGKSIAAMAYAAELEREFGEAVPLHGGNSKLDLKSTLESVEPETMIYVCGPERLVSGVLQAARTLKFPTSQIRFERFE